MLSNIMVNRMGIPSDVASAVAILIRLCVATAELLWVLIGIIYQRRNGRQAHYVDQHRINPS